MRLTTEKEELIQPPTSKLSTKDWGHPSDRLGSFPRSIWVCMLLKISETLKSTNKIQ